MNRIRVGTGAGEVEYLVDCRPGQPYKPFEGGLVLLVLLAALTLTLSAAYSRAWSYRGFGVVLTRGHVLAFNLLLLTTIVLAYAWPQAVSLGARVAGTLVGGAGVAVCLSELLWLTRHRGLRKELLGPIRRIDLVSFTAGTLAVVAYWATRGWWVLNDAMAVCATVALMKLLKLPSLARGCLLLLSLLAVEAGVGVAVHFGLGLSYNNYVVNLFQNPALLVMPSLTPLLYRQCAWLPITAVLFPGLLLSYLRRFDHSRSTRVFFAIGLAAFYLGSLLWVLVDQETIHALPFAIFAEPVTLLMVALHSYRRNEFRILWTGRFHDEELLEHEYTRSVAKETEIVGPSAYADLTGNLRITHETDSSDQYRLILD